MGLCLEFAIAMYVFLIRRQLPRTAQPDAFGCWQ